VSFDGAPYTQLVEAEFLAIEHGVLVFRDAPAGVIRFSWAAGHWKAVETVERNVDQTDRFSTATRDVVQG